MPGVRKLSDAEHEALRLLLDLAQEHCFEMRFAPGDIQLLNNHVIYHGRTAFKDDASTNQDRMLMRLWLGVPNSRALPNDRSEEHTSELQYLMHTAYAVFCLKNKNILNYRSYYA